MVLLSAVLSGLQTAEGRADLSASVPAVLMVDAMVYETAVEMVSLMAEKLEISMAGR